MIKIIDDNKKFNHITCSFIYLELAVLNFVYTESDDITVVVCFEFDDALWNIKF